MISPVSLHYMTIVMGHNTLGFNTRAAASSTHYTCRHNASIQRTSCVHTVEDFIRLPLSDLSYYRLEAISGV
jgi:hypothetical protein